MPKPSSKKAKGVVARLIQEKPAARVTIEGEAREFVEAILEHNDSSHREARISRIKTAETLRTEFALDMSPQTLERWVRTELGRSTWGRK